MNQNNYIIAELPAVTVIFFVAAVSAAQGQQLSVENIKKYFLSTCYELIRKPSILDRPIPLRGWDVKRRDFGDPSYNEVRFIKPEERTWIEYKNYSEFGFTQTECTLFSTSHLSHDQIREMVASLPIVSGRWKETLHSELSGFFAVAGLRWPTSLRVYEQYGTLGMTLLSYEANGSLPRHVGEIKQLQPRSSGSVPYGVPHLRSRSGKR